MFRYGSILMAETWSPKDLSSTPADDAMIPLPTPEITPPVTTTYFICLFPRPSSPKPGIINCPCLYPCAFFTQRFLGQRAPARAANTHRTGPQRQHAVQDSRCSAAHSRTWPRHSVTPIS